MRRPTDPPLIDPRVAKSCFELCKQEEATPEATVPITDNWLTHADMGRNGMLE